MQIHQVKPQHKRKTKKRVGRGGKRGTYCGRGVKGQKSRAGGSKEPIIRSVIKRYPKLRGYKFGAKKKLLVTVNLRILQEKFQDGETVSPKSLIELRIIRKMKGRVPITKILAKGDLSKKLTIKNCQTSEQAKLKIEKAKGKVL
jgi:large subunit ribosomal protein L15